MGEIVDLERYRKQRRRREAETEKVKRGQAPDSGKAEGPGTAPGTPTAVKRAGPGRSGPKGAAKPHNDEPKTD